jgi:hypothetical protein
MILEASWDNLWTLLLGTHNFMVMAIALCVKWPQPFSVSLPKKRKKRKGKPFGGV